MKPIKCNSAELNRKRNIYIKLMRKLDMENMELIARLARVEVQAGKLRKQLNEGRQAREKAKRMVSRYKQMIKNKNRDDNGSEIL